MKLNKLYNQFRDNKDLSDCSFMPYLNTIYNIKNNDDKIELNKRFGNDLFFLGLTNNEFKKSAIRKARNLGVLMFGRWKGFNDISVLINNKPKSDVIKLAKEHKQISILELKDNKINEINTI